MEGTGQLEARGGGERRQEIAAQPVVVPLTHIFISYETETGSAFAESSASAIESKGIAAWVWHLHRRSGDYTITEIAEHIAEADVVLFICTEGTQASDGQKREINTAIGGYARPLWIITPDRQYVPPALRGYNCDVCSLDGVEATCLRLVERYGSPAWPTLEPKATSTTETAEVPQ